MPDQALLPAPWRSRTRHRAFAYDAGTWTGTDAELEGPGVRIVPAGLCARHSRRPRQGAGRAGLPVAGQFFFTRTATTSGIALSCGGLLRRGSFLSSGVMIERSRTKKGRTRTAEASWRIQMRRLVILVALLIVSSAATAQNAGTGSSRSSVNPSRPIPEAPIGHRQPARDQVPSVKNLSDPNNPVNREDAALDRKLKSICRGC